MKIHEYQAKAILARHGVPVPQGEWSFTAEEAEAVADGSAVAFPSSRRRSTRGAAARVAASKSSRARRKRERRPPEILGMTLVTHQTGPSGQKVGRVLVEQGLKIKRELYLGLVIDRSSERPVMMASPDGGVEIEKVAEETPDRIFKEFINPGCRPARVPDAQARVRARSRRAPGCAGREADERACGRPLSKPTPRSSRSIR